MSTKTVAAKKPEKSTENHDDDATEWIALDPETDRGEYGLTPLLSHRLGHKVEGKHATFAQLLAQKLIDLALGGHFLSLEEILIRIDGDAKTSQPAASSANISLAIDEVTAHKILDAYVDSRQGPPGN